MLRFFVGGVLESLATFTRSPRETQQQHKKENNKITKATENKKEYEVKLYAAIFPRLRSGEASTLLQSHVAIRRYIMKYERRAKHNKIRIETLEDKKKNTTQQSTTTTAKNGGASKALEEKLGTCAFRRPTASSSRPNDF